MVLRIPTFKIAGSNQARGAKRPPIFVLLDEDKIALRRDATNTLDPLESSFTIDEARDLSHALLELLKAHSESAAEKARTEQRALDIDSEDGNGGEDEDEDEDDGANPIRPEKPPARIAVALAP